MTNWICISIACMYVCMRLVASYSPTYSLLNEQAEISEQGRIFLKNSYLSEQGKLNDQHRFFLKNSYLS